MSDQGKLWETDPSRTWPPGTVSTLSVRRSLTTGRWSLIRQFWRPPNPDPLAFHILAFYDKKADAFKDLEEFIGPKAEGGV